MGPVFLLLDGWHKINADQIFCGSFGIVWALRFSFFSVAIYRVFTCPVIAECFMVLCIGPWDSNELCELLIVQCPLLSTRTFFCLIMPCFHLWTSSVCQSCFLVIDMIGTGGQHHISKWWHVLNQLDSSFNSFSHDFHDLALFDTCALLVIGLCC